MCKVQTIKELVILYVRHVIKSLNRASVIRKRLRYEKLMYKVQIIKELVILKFLLKNILTKNVFNFEIKFL